MSLLPSSASITRYRVDGAIQENIIQSVLTGLKKHTIQDIDGESTEKSSGWVSVENPYTTNFDTDSYLIGSVFVFSLRIDKKSLSVKVVKKYLAKEVTKRLAASEREKLSKSEIKSLKENVIGFLAQRIPATPHIYTLVWHYEDAAVWFLSNLKSANEELETFFYKSFNLRLIRFFPYTESLFSTELSEKQTDKLNTLSPTLIME